MSGHSKWSKIKRAKAVNDSKKSKVLTKRSKEITLAVQEGGGDPEMNFTLRLAIQKAKDANVPSDNIQRAIKRGTGELKGENPIVFVMYEGYGPGKTAILIDCQTDNTNRTVSEIRNIVESRGGKLSPAGSVAWQFEEVGVIVLRSRKFQEAEQFGKEGKYIKTDQEDLLMELMDIPGVIDILIHKEEGEKDLIEVRTNRDAFHSIHKQISGMKLDVETAELSKIAKDEVNLSEEDYIKLDNFIEALEDQDDVVNVWHNASDG